VKSFFCATKTPIFSALGIMQKSHLEVEGKHYTGIEFIEKNMIAIGDCFKS
jgi:hypothetical protein